MEIYDTIIIGGGAAGLTAAIYAARRTLKTLVISQDIGGQAATTTHIENYPGYDLVDGAALMQKFQQQAEKFGADFTYEEVTKIDKLNDGNFKIKTSANEYLSKTLILAFGLTRQKLGVPGEEKLAGKGVAYCATCDAPLYKGKTVAVVGGGNSALDAALLLSKISPKVYIIHRRDEFRGDEILVNKIKNAKNIELVLNSKPAEIKGDKLVESIVVSDVSDESKQREIKVRGVFVEIGLVAKPDIIKGLVDLDKKNQVITTKDGATSYSGIFAAGDITDIQYKQVVISAGEGAKAALQAYKYLQGKKGAAVGIDWGMKK